jgi:hypothetical protein
MTSPGAGAGNTAAANAIVKSVLPALHNALNAFPVGDKKYKAVMKAVQVLGTEFGQSEDKNLVPAGIQQMAAAAQKGGPVVNAPAPGLAAAAPKMAA